MPQIRLLDKSIAEKIAAGEVVERPASVVKEIVENSIDAGADRITIEIERGGISLIRVTDNGCGISRNDVPKAFLRHATSKIRHESDLDSIATLGFRGEALAAVSAVARVEMITCDGSDSGTIYQIAGGEEILFDEIGCAKGTILTVRDLFFNTPARMKFLKKDVSEGNAVASVVDRIALSHPEVAFRFIRDGKQVLTTSGDGKLLNVVCSVLGREFASSLIPINYSLDGVTVSGYICKPIACKPNRNYQFFFINGRLVKSMTASVAMENAYKNSMMVGKCPACILYIGLGYDTVDVNVHPAKTEVRFSDEKKVFDCIYFGARSALNAGDTRPNISNSSQTGNRFKSQPDRMSLEQYKQTVIKTAAAADHILSETEKKPTIKAEPIREPAGTVLKNTPVHIIDLVENKTTKDLLPDLPAEKKEEQYFDEPLTKEPKNEPIRVEEILEEEPIRLIGEAFSTYIIIEKGNSIFLIDKHAAHERILFEQLKNEKAGRQQLITSASITVTKEEYQALIQGQELLERAGFEIEDFGNGTVLVRTVPANLAGEDISSLVSEMANSLMTSGRVTLEKLDDLYHRVACRSAIKAGNHSTERELLHLAKQVLFSDDIMYCPHGRPVAFEISKHSLEKHFGRV